MLRNIFCFFILFFTLPIMAQDVYDIKTTEEIMTLINTEKPTNCVGRIFSNALITHSDEIDETDTENKVRAWAQQATINNINVLEAMLNCPEVKNAPDTTTINFSPIVYTFPNNRSITINYSTQPKFLKQKLLVLQKPSLPNGDPNPKLMDPNDPAKYINTDPAWYAIMVVQHDALKDFVGPNKNNTLSLEYINNNIDSIYPRGYYCTSRSAISNNDDTINQVVRQLVDVENDTNDYYVAGDVNLEWVMYTEIAADVLLTVATAGIGQVGMIQLKSIRAFKNGKKILKSVQELKKLDDVKDYMAATKKITQYTNDIENLAKYEKSLKNISNAKKSGKDTSKYIKESSDVLNELKKANPNLTAETINNSENIAKYRKELQDGIKTAEKESQNLLETSENVKKYKEQSDLFKDLDTYFKEIRAYRRPQTGNVITSNLKKIIKPIRAANTGARTMSKAGKAARAGMSSYSAKIGDWLMDKTLQHGARLARFERDVGLFYGAVNFLGDMYDKTSTVSKEFSNGIEFKPLCLLSADDLAGQENVVNYGMWLMWIGNSTDPADDDAAYLQAMDFATKFYYKLDEFQDENGAQCDVDIYVVRPIIRLDETDTNNPRGEMFYLFMNEIPWSTADQFENQKQNSALLYE